MNGEHINVVTTSTTSADRHTPGYGVGEPKYANMLTKHSIAKSTRDAAKGMGANVRPGNPVQKANTHGHTRVFGRPDSGPKPSDQMNKENQPTQTNKRVSRRLNFGPEPSNQQPMANTPGAMDPNANMLNMLATFMQGQNTATPPAQQTHAAPATPQRQMTANEMLAALIAQNQPKPPTPTPAPVTAAPPGANDLVQKLMTMLQQQPTTPNPSTHQQWPTPNPQPQQQRQQPAAPTNPQAQQPDPRYPESTQKEHRAMYRIVGLPSKASKNAAQNQLFVSAGNYRNMERKYKDNIAFNRRSGGKNLFPDYIQPHVWNVIVQTVTFAQHAATLNLTLMSAKHSRPVDVDLTMAKVDLGNAIAHSNTDESSKAGLRAIMTDLEEATASLAARTLIQSEDDWHHTRRNTQPHTIARYKEVTEPAVKPITFKKVQREGLAMFKAHCADTSKTPYLDSAELDALFIRLQPDLAIHFADAESEDQESRDETSEESPDDEDEDEPQHTPVKRRKSARRVSFGDENRFEINRKEREADPSVTELQPTAPARKSKKRKQSSKAKSTADKSSTPTPAATRRSPRTRGSGRKSV